MSVQFWIRAAAAMTAIGITALGSPAHANSIDGSFSDLAAQAGAPGGAIAYIEDGVVERTETFGSTGDGEPVQATTQMLWGSTSKSVAAAVAVRLHEGGVLDLDAPVSSYLDGGPDVPVRSLLNHTSGMPFGAADLDVTRPGTTAVEVAVGLDPELDAAGEHRYSSLGYLYLQAAIEAATGKPYADSLAGVAPGAGATAEDCSGVAAGHRLAGPFAVTAGIGYDGAGATYGYTCGSVEDLAAFAVAQLGGEKATFDAQIAEPVETGRSDTRYGLGWRVTSEPDERTTVWHTGTVPGYFSAIYLDPETGDGAVVLLNASGFLHEEALAAATRAAYDQATGRDQTQIPSAWMASAIPVGLLALAAIAAVALIRGRPGGRRAVVVWAALAGLVAIATLVVAPMLMGVPLRYFWLWEPALVVGAGVLLATLTGGLTSSIVRLRR
ncbi:serine hydrolase [Blastococcus sp. Marseille-P5729]|uniref:serine hydrolase domain-containing protein n=1 Tax=Blastococcus sp. Marseille-P5729 TaxID=2086582 RepID=UPI00131BD4FF|nr:serine hydrolase domain-containing protein [Blastococcus sp. Marseille-P5729]